MIQVLGGDAHATDCQCSLAEIVITDRRGQLREGDRKIWMLHLRGQNCFEALAQAARRVEIPLAAFGEHRREEGKALDMVPVRMSDQQVAMHGMLGLCHQRQPETMGARAAVQHDQGSVVRPCLDTGRIAPVAQGGRPGRRQ